MSCKFHPASPTETIPYPKEWCNIRWGYCQWEKDCDYSVWGCPLAGEYQDGDWFTYWVNGQTDLTRKIAVKIYGKAAVNLTISELSSILNSETSLSVENINVIGEIEDSSDSEEDDQYKYVETSTKSRDISIYDGDKLITLGRKAFYGTDNQYTLTSIELPYCLYIGSYAFYGCDNLTLIDFSKKEDSYIPILDDINAFYRTDETINPDLKIKVPSRLYSQWIQAPNWVALKDYIISA